MAFSPTKIQAGSVCPTINLADVLRKRTRDLHTRAERSGIIAEIIKGRAELYGYVLLQRNLFTVYQRMEAALKKGIATSGSGLAGIAQPALYRASSLRSDLEQLHGPGWIRDLPILPATRLYADRLDSLTGPRQELLISHAYVRYLGDLNGGQILQKLLMKSLGLGRDALTFFDFPQLSDLDAARSEYRGAINSAGRNVKSIEVLINEASVAFELNIEISQQALDHTRSRKFSTEPRAGAK